MRRRAARNSELHDARYDHPRPDTPHGPPVAGAIVSWFAENARALPWRSRRSGYTALVSEIMLQQTQVDRVEPRYRAFLKRFPSVQSLAEADEADVLKAWEGLGYYRRARMLHAAARIIVSDMGGRIPRNLGELRRLPGVGRYTAGAICSIVHGQKTAIVDGNIARLLARIDGVHLPRGEQAFDTWCWKRAQTLVDASDDPARFNEGMMELGAVVCTPRSPRCRGVPGAYVLYRFAAGDPGGSARPSGQVRPQRCAPSRGHHHEGLAHPGRASAGCGALGGLMADPHH
jgi:A/G-specific adenine glycosylase